MQIPGTYRLDDSDYITIPVMKKFCFENDLRVTGNRMDFIQQIEEFANRNQDNEAKVILWLEEVLKMGIKTCIITKINPINNTQTDNDIEEKINAAFPSFKQKNIINCQPEKETKLYKYELEKDENGDVVRASFYYIISLVKVINNYSDTGKTISYPVYIDIDLKNGFCISRAKSSSGLFKVGQEQNKIETSNATSSEKLMKFCATKILNVIEWVPEDVQITKNTFKKVIFKILDSYTKTPRLIQNKIDGVQEECKIFAEDIFRKVGIDLNGKSNKDDVLYDLKIFVEKYISITYPDKSIFMEDRKAYPVKFLAQDNEFTKIQEHTSGDDPLQSKKAFFDSKKVVYTNKKCDQITLCQEREAKKYYTDKYFTVSLSLVNGSCMVKFMCFVEEGDIEDVLSRVIQEYVV